MSGKQSSDIRSFFGKSSSNTNSNSNSNANAKRKREEEEPVKKSESSHQSNGKSSSGKKEPQSTSSTSSRPSKPKIVHNDDDDDFEPPPPVRKPQRTIELKDPSPGIPECTDGEFVEIQRKRSRLSSPREATPELKAKENGVNRSSSSSDQKKDDPTQFFSVPVKREEKTMAKSPPSKVAADGLFNLPGSKNSNARSPPVKNEKKDVRKGGYDDFESMLDDPNFDLAMLDEGVVPKELLAQQQKALDQAKGKSPPSKPQTAPHKVEKQDKVAEPSQKKQKTEDSDTDVDEDPKPGSKGAPTTPSKKKGETKPPATPEEEAENKKKKATNFVNYKIREQKRAQAQIPGAKEIPEGQPFCLQGLKLVFTGDLVGLSREDASDLVRRYGGEIGSSVSGKTNYVVVGQDPGDSKMAKVRQLGIRTLDEDQFYDMIRTRPAQEEKLTKEVEKVRLTQKQAAQAQLAKDKEALLEKERQKEKEREQEREREKERERQREREREREKEREKERERHPKVKEENSGAEDMDVDKEKPFTIPKSPPQMSPPPVAMIAAISPAQATREVKTSPFFNSDKIVALTKQISSPNLKGKAKEQPKIPPKTSLLWTDKYAPKRMEDIVGNKGLVDRILHWLVAWHTANRGASSSAQAAKAGAKVKDAKKSEDSAFKGLLISGPPGIGKTTSINVVAKEAGYEVIEFNASDTRSKKSLHEEVSDLVGNRGISEFYRPEGQRQKGHNKVVLVMEEVDGMSGSDRGGIGELVKLIQSTKIPIICVCNDSANPKMRPLIKCTSHLKFNRPDIRLVRDRMLLLAEKEGLHVQGSAMDQIISGCGNDIRQIVTMLSCYRLGSEALNYDQSKHLMNVAGKNVEISFFDAVGKLLGSRAFESGKSIDDLMEYYFVDFSLMPLMVQENYIKLSPIMAQCPVGRKVAGDATLLELQYLSNAADSISDGDLCSSLIHGDQEWSLLPVHGILSCVRPAYYCHGPMSRGTGFGGGGYDFAGWLGKNSSQQKFTRILKELHLHMGLRVSGSKYEFRETYLPVLKKKLIHPLATDGPEGIPEAIETMEYYYLNREDFDNILELTHNFGREDEWKAVNPKVKATFTRNFNQQVHMVPYAEGAVVKGKQKAAPVVNPDLEEAADREVFEEGEENDEEGKEEGDGEDGGENVANDKMIVVKKAGTKKGSGSTAAKSGAGQSSSSASSRAGPSGSSKGKRK